MLKIDFGSGYNPYKNYKTCDITYSPCLDYVYDVNINKILGLKKNSVNIFRLKNVLHHTNINLIAQCLYKYLKQNGKVIIIEPKEKYYDSNRCLDIFWYRYIYPRYEISIPPCKRINYIKIFDSYNFKFYKYFDTGIYDTYILKKMKNNSIKLIP